MKLNGEFKDPLGVLTNKHYLPANIIGFDITSRHPKHLEEIRIFVWVEFRALLERRHDQLRAAMLEVN
jgi:hypothetical protein